MKKSEGENKKRGTCRAPVVFLTIALLTASAGALLVGCGQDANVRDPVSAVSQDTSDSGMNAASDVEGTGETSGSEKDPTALFVQRETALPEEDILSEEAAQTAQFELYDAQDIRITLIYALDADSNRPFWTMKQTNASASDRIVQTNDLILNNHILSNDSTFEVLPAGKTEYSVLRYLEQDLSCFGEQQLTELEGEVLIYEGSTHESLAEDSFSLTLPALPEAALFFEPCLDARAERQVLVDNNDIRITLLGCGRLLEADYTSHNDLQGILFYENFSEEDRPIGVETAAVNGITVERSGDFKETLPAGMTAYRQFEFSEQNLEEQDITSIFTVSLMILSDEKELSGTVNHSGGSWYDLELSMAGLAEEAEPDGELVYEEDDVAIYYRSREQKQNTFSYEIGTWYDSWMFTVVNHSDESFDLKLQDVFLDGEADGTDFTTRKLFISSDETVGANTRKNIKMTIAEWPVEDYPELRFRFQFRSVGGGSILYTSDQEIVIPAK